MADIYAFISVYLSLYVFIVLYYKHIKFWFSDMRKYDFTEFYKIWHTHNEI